MQSSSNLTFLTLKDVTAVSRTTAGLAGGYGTLPTRALGLVAGTEVAGALGWYGGTATIWGGVTLGQDRILWAGRYLQGRTHDPGTPQLLWETETDTNQG